MDPSENSTPLTSITIPQPRVTDLLTLVLALQEQAQVSSQACDSKLTAKLDDLQAACAALPTLDQMTDQVIAMKQAVAKLHSIQERQAHSTNDPTPWLHQILRNSRLDQ